MHITDAAEEFLVIPERLVAGDIRVAQLDEDCADVLVLSLDGPVRSIGHELLKLRIMLGFVEWLSLELFGEHVEVVRYSEAIGGAGC